MASAMIKEPENIIRRSQELFAEGLAEDAMSYLKSSLSNRRLKFGYNPLLEDIVKEIIDVSIYKLKTQKHIKESLVAFRAITQQVWPFELS
jgi:hypothetical protein